ncbi:porin family protein [Pseudoduganella sp. LjRoot289]|uniref:porin family protein n=1 Tax=Pseudoduganella sp. LjRoot289 TaxID=3342314 RepID=UPI003ECCC481
MSKALISTLLATAVLASSCASAQDYFAGVTVAKGGELTFRNPLNGNTDKDDAGAVFKVYGGYALTDYLALEGGYSQGAKARFDKAALGMASDPTFKLNSFYLAARATHSFNDSWSVFGKLGVARNRYTVANTGNSDRVSSTKPLLGVGIAYNVTKDVALTLEAERLGRTREDGINVSHNTLQLGVKAGF